MENQETQSGGTAPAVGSDAGSESRPHRIRFNGHTAGIIDIKAGGKSITVCVFQRGHEWNEGDYVIFERQSGETTRYKIYEIETPRDPGDKHFLRCIFAPRPAPPPNTPMCREADRKSDS
jgi:hypothetical protein